MSQVVIGDILPYTQAIAIASQTVFSTNWTANYPSDVVVYYTPLGDTPDDETQILAYPADYSVTFVGAQQEVQVTLVTGAINTGDIVTITRMTPADRENLYTDTNFTPSMLNNDFGILTLVDQQAQLVNQLIAPRYNYSAQINNNSMYPTRDTILPLLLANQIWAMNSTQSAIIAVDLNEIISGGTVTQVNTGTGLTGGPITDAGTISFAAIAANSFWANMTGGVAVPTVTSLSAFLLAANNLSDLTNAATARTNLGLAIGTNVEAWSAALDSIAGLTTGANNLIYTTASNTYHVLAPVIDSVLISSHTGVPTWTLTLPQGVQTNIQYLGVQNQNLNMGGFQINDMADPTQPQDAATKSYVDLNALTGTSVYAASTTTLTVTQAGSGVGATLTNAGSQATFALDSVNPPLNSNVLIKNLAAPQNEGIYTVTNVGSNSSNWVLTRASTYDTPSLINNTGLIIVQNGATLSGTAWYNASTIVTVDTTAFSYSEFGNITFPVSLAHGGTNANLTASDGGIFYSTATAGAILAGTATANQLLLSGASSAPSWSSNTWPATTVKGDILYGSAANVISALAIGSDGQLLTIASGIPAYTTSTYPSTATSTGTILRADGTNWSPTTTTYPNTNAINTIMYASSANVLGSISPANSSVLISNGTGVPSWSTTLPSDIAATNMRLTSPSFITGALDANGNNLFMFTATPSAVNYFAFINNSTGSSPVLEALGSDTNITLQLNGKGTGGVAIFGTSTNDNATAGFVGEFISNNILAASAVTMTNNTATNITSIELTAGDWNVWGNGTVISFNTQPSEWDVWISSTSATVPDRSLRNMVLSFSGTAAPLMAPLGLSAPQLRFSLEETTTIYLSGYMSGSSGNGTAAGGIYARRFR